MISALFLCVGNLGEGTWPLGSLASFVLSPLTQIPQAGEVSSYWGVYGYAGHKGGKWKTFTLHGHFPGAFQKPQGRPASFLAEWG